MACGSIAGRLGHQAPPRASGLTSYMDFRERMRRKPILVSYLPERWWHLLPNAGAIWGFWRFGAVNVRYCPVMKQRLRHLGERQRRPSTKPTSSAATISPAIVVAQANKATSAGDNTLQPDKPSSSQAHLATVSMLPPDPDRKA